MRGGLHQLARHHLRMVDRLFQGVDGRAGNAGAAALLAQTWAQAHLPATRSAIIMSMEPVFAAFFAVLLGRSSFTISTVAKSASRSGGLPPLVELSTTRTRAQRFSRSRMSSCWPLVVVAITFDFGPS